ncbi:MAG: HlyD family efflux transporter periplasmic adaptor subunit [Pirellulaceae bacterium]
MAKRRMGYLWLVLLATGIVAALTWGMWPRPMKVDGATVKAGTVVVSVREDGRTRVRERYVVSSPLTGQLLRIDLDPEIPSRSNRRSSRLCKRLIQDYSTPALAPKRSPAFEPLALVKQAEAAVEKARQAVDLASDEYDRAVALLQSNVLKREEFDQAEHRFRMAQADLRSTEFALEVAMFEREQAEAAFVRDYRNGEPASDDSGASEGSSEIPSDVDAPMTETEDGTATLDMEETLSNSDGAEPSEPEQILVMTAPVSGRVLRVFQESAGPVQVGTPLLELGDPVDLEVEVDVLSEDAVRIQPGAHVIIDQWGGEGQLLGVVSRVEPAAFVKVSALGVEEQRVNVIIDFREPPERYSALGDGYRIEGAIEVARAENVLTVPADALFREGEQWALFVVEDGVARKKIVEVGLSDGLITEILSGAVADQVIISHPSNQLSDGSSVEVRE